MNKKVVIKAELERSGAKIDVTYALNMRLQTFSACVVASILAISYQMLHPLTYTRYTHCYCKLTFSY